MGKMTHEEYLKHKIKLFRIALQALDTQYQVDTARYNAKTDFYRDEIRSMEKQLDETGE